jgi:hypothetical protein
MSEQKPAREISVCRMVSVSRSRLKPGRESEPRLVPGQEINSYRAATAQRRAAVPTTVLRGRYGPELPGIVAGVFLTRRQFQPPVKYRKRRTALEFSS